MSDTLSAPVSRAIAPLRKTPESRLERTYAEHGWRWLLNAYVVLSWIGGLAASTLGGLVIARLDRWSGTEVAETLGGLVPIWLVGLAVAIAASLRVARPLRVLDHCSDQAELRSAWAAGSRWAVAASGWNCIVALVWVLPAILGLVELTVSPGALVFLLVLLVGIACIVVAGGVGLFGAQLATRPILSDIEDRLDPHPTPHAGASVRLRLLVAVPAFTVMTAGGGVLIGAAPGTDHGTLLLGLAIAVAASVVIAVPVTMLLAHSLLHPLDEIVAATERLQKGDFTKTVPELAADEYGKLARSLNDAMKGLAERQQLSAENEKLLADVRASRARIVAASDAERRRVERNIHDGAQQRLVALALDLRMIEDLAATEHSGELESRVRAAGENLRDALEELRELAQGLHPSVLSTDGLAPALAQLAAVAPLAVSLDVPEQRFAEEIESTLYFVASEALANVAKYARASRAEVTVEAQGRQVAIEIVDDGVGGADPGSGSGLAGLDDRVAALGGHVAVESPPGQGTRVTAKLPLQPHE
jgi:signal transduction histidine kinase